jgi:nitrogenase molybdenum-iron protein alpha chain
MIKEDRPDIVLAGIKEKYLVYKYGVPSLMIHSYENGPYIGFEGFLNLAKDLYANIYNPVWNLLEFEKNPQEVPEEELLNTSEDKNTVEAAK